MNRTAVDPAVVDFLLREGLAASGEESRWTPLTGGVSSDLWRVDLPGRSICVKRARERLRVAADWHAPVSRNAHEWAWLEFAARHRPANVPVPLAHDPAAGLFAMSYLPPEHHPVWKGQLLSGKVDEDTARAVGDVLGRLHRASTGDPDLAREFATDDTFHALRLEPYLLATATAHPRLGRKLRELADRTAGTRLALAHGDVSPKNILAGPAGPVLLDAECAWYGDPAFDLAFCLNHLLLKCLVRPEATESLLDSAKALALGYFAHVDWEPRQALEYRAATLLPALLLARVDGKSPVEYLDGPAPRDLVRRVATRLLLMPAGTLLPVLTAWRRALPA
ncbi:phosphotransferase family protein [Streptomyces sp. NBC_00582]|uniref:phosphotransferase family protein n=1 Tax=Streptomyces sp. NBC_00582 TaxID=2975783 RepID=UPI002E816A6E|nr:aminoglycoside phosphotransferase family protein [Streptomyces sp. NBC_00582]WUB67269.1 aminoglycoside phosphotransferase family protein [Streptomyces sp. NBC_00582]